MAWNTGARASSNLVLVILNGDDLRVQSKKPWNLANNPAINPKTILPALAKWSESVVKQIENLKTFTSLVLPVISSRKMGTQENQKSPRRRNISQYRPGA